LPVEGTKVKIDDLMSFLSDRAKTKSDINEHLELLYRIVVETDAQKIVELGTRSGNSTCALVIGAFRTGGHVVSVDNGMGDEYTGELRTFSAVAETSDLITHKLGLADHWTLVNRDDLEFAEEYHDEIDVLFIDTVHSYEQTKKELDAWGNKVVSGGFIVIHDTVSFPEQNVAIWEYLDQHLLSDYVEYENCNGLGIIIKETRRPRKSETKLLSKYMASAGGYEHLRRMQQALVEMRSRLKTIPSLESENAELLEQLNRVKTALAERESLIQSLEAGRILLLNDLENTRNELSRSEAKIELMAAENAHLRAELDSVMMEIAVIQHSLVYRFIRFCGSIIDRVVSNPTAKRRISQDSNSPSTPRD
jgi:predicted O-methyltransferase YrrM